MVHKKVYYCGEEVGSYIFGKVIPGYTRRTPNSVTIYLQSIDFGEYSCKNDIFQSSLTLSEIKTSLFTFLCKNE